MSTAIPAWYDDALCAEVEYEAFFPDDNGTANPARAICALCDVRAQCLNFALAHHPLDGVWGGTTMHERRYMNAEVA